AVLLYPQRLKALPSVPVREEHYRPAKLDLQVFGFELLVEQVCLIRLKKLLEFGCMEMIDDDIPFRTRILATELGDGDERARLRRALVQKRGRKFLRERRLGKQASQKFAYERDFGSLRAP